MSLALEALSTFVHNKTVYLRSEVCIFSIGMDLFLLVTCFVGFRFCCSIMSTYINTNKLV